MFKIVKYPSQPVKYQEMLVPYPGIGIGYFVVVVKVSSSYAVRAFYWNITVRIREVISRFNVDILFKKNYSMQTSYRLISDLASERYRQIIKYPV
ncbi:MULTISPECIES: hypothetical protein [Sphingobacterium]|nr:MULTISPECIES: hypothetical protein [Sphingobacterium]